MPERSSRPAEAGSTGNDTLGSSKRCAAPAESCIHEKSIARFGPTVGYGRLPTWACLISNSPLREASAPMLPIKPWASRIQVSQTAVWSILHRAVVVSNRRTQYVLRRHASPDGWMSGRCLSGGSRFRPTSDFALLRVPADACRGAVYNGHSAVRHMSFYSGVY